MGRQVSKHKKRLAEKEEETIREDYVQKMKDNYPLIIRTLMHDIIVSIDKDGNFVFVNDAAVEFLGESSEELIGANFAEYLHPDDVGKAMGILQELMGGKDMAKDFIIRVKNPPGFRTLAMNGIAVFDDEGNYIGAHATGRDLTDLLRTEEELKWSKKQFQSIFEVMVDPVVIVNMNGNILELSQSAEEILGFPKEELVGKHFLETDAATVESKALMAKNLEKLKTGLYIEPHPIEVITKDGTKLLYELNTARINHKGEPAVLAIFRNITEQKKVEEKLQESEERFNRFLENAPEAIWVQDLIGTFLNGNKRAEEITGYDRDELIGKNMLEANLVPEKYVPVVLEALSTVQVGERSAQTEFELIRKDGSLVSVETSAIPVERDGKIEVIGIARDITERKKMENMLKDSEEKYRTIFEGATDGIAALDPKTMKVIFVNPKMTEITGYPLDELLNATIIDFVPKNEISSMIQQFQNHVGGKRDLTRYIPVVRKDKTRIYCDVRSKFLNIGNQQYLMVFVRDVTEQKKAEEALRESEKKYREMINAMNDTALVLDFDTNIIDANQTAAKVLGYSREELLSMKVQKLDASLTAEAMKGLAKKMETHGLLVFETTHTTKDGKTFPVEVSASHVTYQGKSAILSIARDITERKKAEKELIRLSSAVKMSNDSIVITDLDGAVVDVNDATLKMYGTDNKKELIGTASFDLIIPEEREKVLADMEEVLEKGYVQNQEYTVTPKDGSKIPVEMSTAIMKDANGEPIGFVTISRDITERKKAEEALRSSEEAARRLLEFQNKIIDTATVWVNLIDPKGNVILWNRAAELVSGYSRKEIVGNNKMWELLYPDPDYRAKIFAIGKEITKEGKRIEDFHSTIRCKDGSLKTISWYATNIADEKGEPAGSLSIGIDVTEREKARQAIDNALSLLRQSNKELENYTYVVSHDLKAPLRTIRSFGSFILEDYGDKLDETGKDYLNRMVNASSHLDTMIEDLLVLSRVGRKFTEREKVDLNKLLKEILTDLEATIKERNAKVVVDKLPTLYVHRVWKRQLFMNLISNALKFNESKTPKIEVLYEERETDHLFKVRDNGIGIEEKYLERIFNLFDRAPTEKKYEGTGAGLAICKKIVEHFGGKIWVESTPGKGSTFSFTIPKETVKQKKET